MSAVNTSTSSSQKNTLWYFASMGAGFATAVLFAAVLPDGFAGIPFTGLLVLLALIDRLASRFGVSPFTPRRTSWVFLLIVVVVLISSVVLVITVVRPNHELWLAWVSAGLIVLVFFGGWIAERRSTGKTAIAP